MTYPPQPPTLTPPPAWPGPQAAPDPEGRPLVDDQAIQGNVLAAFNKDHQVLLFMQLPSLEVGRAWLTEMLPRIATNAAVADFNARFRFKRHQSGRDPEDMTAVWNNISFTADGFRLLSPNAITGLSEADPLDPGLQVWLDGANSPAVVQALQDSSSDSWLFGKPDAEVHVVVCVAADRAPDLELEVNRHRERAARHGIEVVFEQPGATLPGAAAGHEHFGFKDGISQPGVLGFDTPNPDQTGEVEGKPGTDLVAAGNFVLGYPREDGTAVSVPKWMFDGSFLVIRRLAQDVPAFWTAMEQQQAALSPAVQQDPDTGIPSADALAARLVGRWRSGTPTARATVADLRSAQDPAQDNNFDFSDDPTGARTPACAHIRKVYPRSGATNATTPVTEDDTRRRRILRRGIPFGLPFAPTDGRGSGVDGQRGLVFQCYQVSIEDQFLFLQQSWINAPDFPEPGTGIDPVIGIGGQAKASAAGQDTELSFARFVETEGSVFAFTPSIPTLHEMAGGQELVVS